MDNKETIKQYLNTIISNGFSTAKGRTDGGSAKLAIGIVKRKLGSKLYTNDLRDIAQDALSEVVTKALSALEEGTSESLSKASSLSDVEGYIRRGIENYCNTRLERWSDNKRPSKDKSDEESGQSAARARVPIRESSAHMASFWDSNINTDFHTDFVDKTNILNILENKGLSQEEIDIIKWRLSGESFTEMAKRSEQSPDKFRKTFNRAIKKAELEGIKEFI